MEYSRSLAGPTTWPCLMQQWKYSQCVHTGHPVFFCVAIRYTGDDLQGNFKTLQLQAAQHREANGDGTLQGHCKTQPRLLHSPRAAAMQGAECLLPCPEISTQDKKKKTKGKISPFALRYRKPSFTIPSL